MIGIGVFIGLVALVGLAIVFHRKKESVDLHRTLKSNPSQSSIQSYTGVLNPYFASPSGSPSDSTPGSPPHSPIAHSLPPYSSTPITPVSQGRFTFDIDAKSQSGDGSMIEGNEVHTWL